jgi:phosphatidylserine decarboxylase
MKQMIKNSFFIAQEGFRYIAVAMASFMIFLIIDFDFLAFLAVLTIAVLAFLYRNPERVTPHHQPLSITAICDGVITNIETLSESKHFDTPCICITIKNSILDVSILRAPFNSNFEMIEFKHGTHLKLNRELSKKLNSHAVVKFIDNHKNKIVCDHTIEYGFDEIHIYSTSHLKEAQRYGLMISGESKIYLPESSKISVKVRDNLEAGESLIGYFA